MSASEIRESFGHAVLKPDGEVIAGSYGTWELAYTAGARGVAAGGRLRIYTESDTDWGLPQFQDPAGADYISIEAPKEARVALTVQSVTSLTLSIGGQGLKPGEALTVTYGDRTGGGPGSRAQTFLEGKHFFRVAVDTDGSGGLNRLPDPPCVTIVGGDAERLIVVAPSTAVVGEPFRLQVRGEDAWGNPAAAYRGTVEIQASGVEVPEGRLAFGAEQGGVRWIEGCVARQAGVQRISAREVEGERHAESNPILCSDRAGTHGLYWGDYHGGQIAMAEKIRDFFRYARDVAAIEFAAYQRNDHAVSKHDWALQQQAEREFYEPGRFVPIPGFEWSAKTDGGGHHNVLFRRFDQPIRRSGHGGLADKSDAHTDLPHILDVYREYRGADVVITPHVGGEHADLTYHDPTLEPAVEISSTHGSFEWILKESLEYGYRLGFLGGSDSHTGRPGTDHPGHQLRRYAKSGLAGVYASEVTLEGFLEALKARRCYATTSARMLMRADADGHQMGEEYTASSPPEISVFIAGTAPLESAEIFRGLEKVYSHPLNVPLSGRRVRILWEGASRKSSYSGVIWDGSVKVTGGGIASVEKVRFDSPRSHVFDVEVDGLRWHSVTCGYRSGVILELDEDDAEVQIAIDSSVITGPEYGEHGEIGPRRMSYAPAERVCFSAGLQELADGPKSLDLGILDRRVTVSLAPEAEAAKDVTFTFTDPSPQPGVNPYWVRAVQTDMEMGWTSPVFVDYAPPV